MDDTQPKKGDVVLHCAHIDRPVAWHWWKAHGLYFVRPDRTAAHAAWIVACGKCFIACEGDPTRLEIVGDGTWDGHPVTYVKES